MRLLLRSTFRIFGFALDTSPRKKCKRACFFLSAYSYLCPIHAGMVELVDSEDLGSSAERCVGSSPTTRTNEALTWILIGKLPPAEQCAS